MDITQYFKEEGPSVYFEESMASEFAKGIAGDFNPIHDEGSKRFCVPGDLLFSVLLHRYGAAQKTRVQFSGMLDGNTRISLPAKGGTELQIVDARERPLLSLFQQGRGFLDKHFISELCEQYVKFSGQTFPGVLVPLMKASGFMINPDRPLVIYKDMAIDLDESAVELFLPVETGDCIELAAPLEGRISLMLCDSDISVDGRKGLVRLVFGIDVDGQRIGSGEKNMVLSGLREFDDSAMQAVVDQYNARRDEYTVHS